MWLKVPTDFCHYISIASHYGFQFHHTQPKHVMMYLWLPEDVPDKVPAFGTHHVGVAGERLRATTPAASAAAAAATAAAAAHDCLHECPSATTFGACTN